MGAKGFVSFILGIIGCGVAFFLFSGDISDTIIKISIGLILASFIDFCAYMYENRKRIRIIFKTWLYKPNKPIRITTAYLFRIELNGKYLLIKRHKKDRQGFQPIGGTFKYLKDENREIFDKLGIEPCHYIDRDDDSENDLRIIIHKRRKLNEYLKWFESRKNRELDPWREFYEELIEPDLLPFNYFKHIQYTFIRKTEELVIPSPVYPIDEFRYAEIYELKFENDFQKQAIVSLLDKSDTVVLATPEEIRKGSTKQGIVILPHSYKILPK